MASQDSAKTFNVDMWQINIKVVITNVLMLSGFALIGGIFIPWLLGTYRRGFFCNDLSIRYTYKDSTVSSTCLILYAFCVIIFTIFVAELYSTRGLKRNFYEEFKVGTITVHPMIVAALTYIGYSQIGLAITYVITNLTKNAVGRLRPHFLDVCKPSDVICSIDDYATYITNYTCTGDAQLVLEARKSFFSGHSSIAMYASTYAVLYLQSRLLRTAIMKVALPIIQTVIISIGLLISYSRINDNNHHWSDVVVGIIVGVFVASFNCIVWCKMFARHQDEVLPLNRGKRLSHGNSLWRPVNVSRQSASSNVDQKDNHAVVSVTQQNPMIV